jgi:hypothetical protein
MPFSIQGKLVNTKQGYESGLSKGPGPPLIAAADF